MVETSSATTKSPSIEALVVAARRGEKAAFSRLVCLYQRAAIITAQSILRDADRAQDVAQEAFLVAYKNLNQLQIAAAFGPWLLKIVHRRATAMRNNRAEQRLDSGQVIAGTAARNRFLERYDDVVEQLAKLSEETRTIVVLRYVDGYSIEEIVDATGKSTAAIKKQIYRALTWLRKTLSETSS